MEKFLDKIIISILKGHDYREYVLATINKRFVDTVYQLLIKIVEARKKNKNIDWWIKEFLENEELSKREMLWFGGLNEKTVHNMMNTVKRKICVDLSKKNIKSIEMILDELKMLRDNLEIPIIEIKLKYKDTEVVLDERESLLLLNTIATMKLTIQGGAWSEVGKKVEKRLLFSIFELLKIPRHQYILVPDEMKRKGLVENREIDAIVFSDDETKIIRIELKLLGIGNPEIGDEALARGVDLFLTDRLTKMMIEEAEKRGIKVIELRDPSALNEIYKYLKSNGVSIESPPSIKKLEKIIPIITSRFNEEVENKRIFKKAKELVTIKRYLKES